MIKEDKTRRDAVPGVSTTAALGLLPGRLGLGRDSLEELREPGWHGECLAVFLAAVP